MTDFGDVNKSEDFEVLHSYSPLHNVRIPGKDDRPGQYPAMILTTGRFHGKPDVPQTVQERLHGPSSALNALHEHNRKQSAESVSSLCQDCVRGQVSDKFKPPF